MLEHPCRLHVSDEGQHTCVNAVAECAALETEEACAAEPNAQCAWVAHRGPDAYWPYDCIPRRLELDVGTGCQEGAGCFPGCGWSSWFRSSRESAMGAAADLPFNAVSQKILCDRIFKVTANRRGTCAAP